MNSLPYEKETKIKILGPVIPNFNGLSRPNLSDLQIEKTTPPQIQCRSLAGCLVFAARWESGGWFAWI